MELERSTDQAGFVAVTAMLFHLSYWLKDKPDEVSSQTLDKTGSFELAFLHGLDRERGKCAPL